MRDWKHIGDEDGIPCYVGSLKEFNPDAHPYTLAGLFLAANKVEDNSKVAVFLSVIGGKVYSLLQDLLVPDLPQEATYAKLV